MNKNFNYPLIENPFDKDDLKSGMEVLKSKYITMGKNTIKFEKNFTKKLKTKYSLMVNSGSSANLLIFQCLINPLKKNKLLAGDEVLIPALCWSTSLWPIVQSNLKPVFVDINPKTLNICETEIEKKITKKTKAILLVHVLGNSCNMDLIKKIKKKYNLLIIEDTCESLGSKYKKQYLGSIGDFSSFSFYASHQISAGEGGMVTCRNLEDYEIIKSLRSHGWTRGLTNEKQISQKYKNLDKKFIFFNSGYNLRPTDISAAIGFSQFKKLDKFIKIRNINKLQITKHLNKIDVFRENIKILDAAKNISPSWFGISLMLKNNKINKFKFIKILEKNGVETRPIISGNFANQPAIKLYNIINTQNYKNADIVYERGFFIGLPFRILSKLKIKKLSAIFNNSIQQVIKQ